MSGSRDPSLTAEDEQTCGVCKCIHCIRTDTYKLHVEAIRFPVTVYACPRTRCCSEVNENPLRPCTFPHRRAVSESNARRRKRGTIPAHSRSSGSLTTRCRRSQCSHESYVPKGQSSAVESRCRRGHSRSQDRSSN